MGAAIVFIAGVACLGLSIPWLLSLAISDFGKLLSMQGLILVSLNAFGFVLIRTATVLLDGSCAGSRRSFGSKADAGTSSRSTKPPEIPTCPLEFEDWCAARFRESGWHASVTPGSGDHGVDVIASRNDMSVVVQCKLHSRPVGNRAVMEALAGKAFKRANIAIVVATSSFTPKAIELAEKTQTHLVQAHDLDRFISRLNRS